MANALLGPNPNPPLAPPPPSNSLPPHHQQFNNQYKRHLHPVHANKQLKVAPPPGHGSQRQVEEIVIKEEDNGEEEEEELRGEEIPRWPPHPLHRFPPVPLPYQHYQQRLAASNWASQLATHQHQLPQHRPFGSYDLEQNKKQNKRKLEPSLSSLQKHFQANARLAHSQPVVPYSYPANPHLRLPGHIQSHPYPKEKILHPTTMSEASTSNPSEDPANLDWSKLVIELADNANSHLFRHASEITRETKGGYLQGKIQLPPSVNGNTSEFYIRLSLVPSQIDLNSNPLNLHPNLLHINMRTNKKNRKLEDGELPDDVDWQFVFKVQYGDVLRVCPSSNPAHKTRRFTKVLSNINSQDRIREQEFLQRSRKSLMESQNMEKTIDQGQLSLPPSYHMSRLTSVKDGYIEMGNTGLMLNIITPLQKFSKGGTTISDVLKQRYFDRFGQPMSDQSLAQAEDVFTKKKEDRMKLQQVRLLAEVFTSTPPKFNMSALSKVITNSKSKECGPLQLHDVMPSVSCCESETKIVLLSFFKLVSDVKANFILYDPKEESVVYDNHYEIVSRIKQPKDCSVFNQTAIIFTAPKQDIRVMNKIRQLELQLRIAAHRPSDKKMSSNSFEFTYLEHGRAFSTMSKVKNPADTSSTPDSDLSKDAPSCAFCHLFTNSNLRTGEELPIAKPGVQRRIADLKTTPDVLLKMNKEQDKEEEKEDDVCPPPNIYGFSPTMVPTMRHKLATDHSVLTSMLASGTRHPIPSNATLTHSDMFTNQAPRMRQPVPTSTAPTNAIMFDRMRQPPPQNMTPRGILERQTPRMPSLTPRPTLGNKERNDERKRPLEPFNNFMPFEGIRPPEAFADKEDEGPVPSKQPKLETKMLAGMLDSKSLNDQKEGSTASKPRSDLQSTSRQLQKSPKSMPIVTTSGPITKINLSYKDNSELVMKIEQDVILTSPETKKSNGVSPGAKGNDDPIEVEDDDEDEEEEEEMGELVIKEEDEDEEEQQIDKAMSDHHISLPLPPSRHDSPGSSKQVIFQQRKDRMATPFKGRDKDNNL